jgi:hypothetical protein
MRQQVAPPSAADLDQVDAVPISVRDCDRPTVGRPHRAVAIDVHQAHARHSARGVVPVDRGDDHLGYPAAVCALRRTGGRHSVTARGERRPCEPDIATSHRRRARDHASSAGREVDNDQPRPLLAGALHHGGARVGIRLRQRGPEHHRPRGDRRRRIGTAASGGAQHAER